MVRDNCQLERLQDHLEGGSLDMPVGDHLDDINRGEKPCPLWVAPFPELWINDAGQQLVLIPLWS